MAPASAPAPLPDTSDKVDTSTKAPDTATKHKLRLRRASLYLLEGILQQPGPCTTPAKIAKWAKAWEKVRRSNDRTLAVMGATYDIEKGAIRAEAENDLQWAIRSRAFNEAKEAWDQQPVTITVNDKLRDICRDAVTWIHDHREDPKAGVKLGGEFAAELLIALGLADKVTDDELELDLE